MNCEIGRLFKKQRKDRGLEEEIESHVQMHIEDNLRLGTTPEEARRQALINRVHEGGLSESNPRQETMQI